MAVTKVIKRGRNFELVSWTFKDKVHYAIRGKEDEKVVETFAPTQFCKGWDLRIMCIEKLELYDIRGVKMCDSVYRNVVLLSEEVKEGHIFVWVVPTTRIWNYALVVKLGECLIYYIHPSGTTGQFNYSTLQKNMSKGIITVVDATQLPPKVKFPIKEI